MKKPNLSFLSNPEVLAVNLLEPHYSSRFTYINGRSNSFSLNGNWDFLRAPHFDDSLIDHRSLKFRKVVLPRSAEMEVPEELIYTNIEYPWEGRTSLKPGEVDLNANPVNVYRKRFKLPKNFKGERFILRFEGFESAIYVYLNGHFIGYSERLYVDSEFDITDCLEEQNELVVYNFRYSSSSWILGQDFWKMSGLFRQVSILALPKNHLEDLSIETTLDDSYHKGILKILGKTSVKEGMAKLLLDKGSRSLEWEVPIKDHIFELKEKIEKVEGWSAAKPHLYWLTVVLEDPIKKEEETSTHPFGFTRIEKKGGVVLFNGKRLKIKGVNRHEIDYKDGRHVPYEELVRDLEILKQSNVNAIRTSHYPNCREFYELCNLMGFFVMDECCLESHGQWALSQSPDDWVPGSKKEWEAISLDRAKSMYERDKNNPCIFSWSLGNESAGGSNLIKMAEFFHVVDKKRLVHYEGENYDPSLTPHVDMKSFMYKKPDDLKKALEEKPNVPFIQCEFLHAMGTSCGNFDEYIALMKGFDNYMGGFIWDYIDQGLLVKNPRQDEEAWVYGGDEGEAPTSYNFNCNGVIFADRDEAERSPKLANIKNYFCPVDVAFEDDRIFLSLNDEFYAPQDFSFRLLDKVNGKVVNQEKILWHGEKSLTLPKKEYEDEHIRSVVVLQKRMGIVGEFDEFVSSFKYKAKKNSAKVNINEDKFYIGMKGREDEFVFAKEGRYSGLIGLYSKRKSLLSLPPRLTFFRPNTDNDIGNRFAFMSSCYIGPSKMNAPVNRSFEKTLEGYRLTTIYVIPGSEAKASVSYLFGQGDYIDVEINYYGAPNLPSLPCFGIDFTFDRKYADFHYYGRGPVDSYPDAKLGAPLGYYSSNVKNEVLPYSIPQECGHKMDARFIEIPLEEHKKLVFMALEKPFSFKYLPYNEFEIDNAWHLDELPPNVRNNLTIYAAMRGVGGDNSWGAPVHSKYELDASKNYSCKFRMMIEKTNEGE